MKENRTGEFVDIGRRSNKANRKQRDPAITSPTVDARTIVLAKFIQIFTLRLQLNFFFTKFRLHELFKVERIDPKTTLFSSKDNEPPPTIGQ